ncbi:hypothetical protein ES703_26812 [subsurface metagenome]
MSPTTDSNPSKCATGVILYLDLEAQRLIAVLALCHRWDCSTCGKRRLARARAMAVAGAPERIITLTTRPRPGLSTQAAVKWMRNRWNAMLRRLRRNYPRMEYMAFAELHKSGWPHLHILTRGCYVPQRVLSDWWMNLTGSFKVHIQAVDRTWKAVNEATKYMLKTARHFHQAAPQLPVYTMSKGWLPADWAEGDRPAGSYKFYAFASLCLADFSALLKNLHVDMLPVPATPGHSFLARDGPIPDDLTAQTYDVGTWAEKEIMSALDLFFADPARACADVEDLKAKQEFYASGPDQMPDYFEPYTRPPEISPELQLQHQRPLFEQTPAPIGFS